MLYEKAKGLHTKMNAEGEFKFLLEWLNCFKEKHRIGKVDASGEQKSVHAESTFIDKFQKYA